MGSCYKMACLHYMVYYKMVHTDVSYKGNIHYLENKIMIPVINESVLKPCRTAGLVMSEKENSTTNTC